MLVRSLTPRAVRRQGRALSSNVAKSDLSKVTLGLEERRALEDVRVYFLNRLPAGKHESSDEIRQRAYNEWRWIVDSVLNVTKGDSQRGQDAVSRIRQMAKRAVELEEPLAYILGTQPFGPLTIKCRQPTLIPRVETEALVEHVAEQYFASLRCDDADNGSLRILDLCCGTGCIALLLQLKLREMVRNRDLHIKSDILAIDLSSSAVELAKENALIHANDTAEHQLEIQKADVFDDEAMACITRTHGPFNVVVCNPPYIAHQDWLKLDKSVRSWEDRRALVGDRTLQDQGDGLDFYRRLSCLMMNKGFLAPFNDKEPYVAVEIGETQANAVHQIFRKACPKAAIEIWQDQFGLDRAVLVKVVS